MPGPEPFNPKRSGCGPKYMIPDILQNNMHVFKILAMVYTIGPDLTHYF
jgi:hypothetical protein